MAYKVMVVEDDAFLLKAYQIKLTSAGFTVLSATDGVEALELLKKEKPDVILLDLVMPRMDGFATLTEIKKQPALQSIPVIVASNLGQNDEVSRVKAIGATDFITKSDLSMSDLIVKVNKILGVK